MNEEGTLSQTLDRVRPEFLKSGANAAVVANALNLLLTWFEDPLYEAQRQPVLGHIASGQFSLLLDSFYQVIPFGTGGRRGRVGYGPNRINEATVAVSVQGHCNYLLERSPRPAPGVVVVACDTRLFSDILGTYRFLGPKHPLIGLSSKILAAIACEIYAANGFQVYAPSPHDGSGYLSTPELSFLIRRLQARGGINVSASHNHPDDNGFKFFNEHGAQDIPPVDLELMSYMDRVPEIQRIPFEAGLANGSIRYLEPEWHRDYIATNLALRPPGEVRPIRVMYSPLCGTGNSTVGDVLRAAGHDVLLYGPQAEFDGAFTSVPFRLPNPEVPEAASPALGEADAKGADIVLCTDPDADRLGLFAKTPSGGWRYVTGNSIGAILAYYLVADTARGPKRRGLLIKTLVTTRTIEAIAHAAGCPIVPDLLVGFKFIADVLQSLEEHGRYKDVQAQPGDLVLAAEESHGFLLTPHIRDKDAAGAALTLCDLVSALRSEGMFLTEYLDRLSLEFGNSAGAVRSIVMRGIRGGELLSSMMASLRSAPPAHFGEFAVRERRDYLSEKDFGPFSANPATEIQARNVLHFQLEGAWVVIRPSGTEPKAKIYVEVEGRKLAPGGDRAAAAAVAQRLANLVFDDCLERIGFHLPKAASLLPDYVELDLKSKFGSEFGKDLLKQAGSSGGSGNVEQARSGGDSGNESKLQWLKDRLAAYGGGVDPIDTVKSAVIEVCQELAETADEPARTALLKLKSALEARRPKVGWEM